MKRIVPLASQKACSKRLQPSRTLSTIVGSTSRKSFTQKLRQSSSSLRTSFHSRTYDHNDKTNFETSSNNTFLKRVLSCSTPTAAFLLIAQSTNPLNSTLEEEIEETPIEETTKNDTSLNHFTAKLDFLTDNEQNDITLPHDPTLEDMDTSVENASHFEEMINNTTLTNSFGTLLETFANKFISEQSAAVSEEVMDDEAYTSETKPNQKLKLASGATIIAHPSKVAKGGEDAYFITEKIIGVADGVGGWNEIGIDPSLYSRKLMEGAQNASREWLSSNSTVSPSQDQYSPLNPVNILRKAYDFVTSHNVIGSTTACVIGLEGSVLRAANLGDSGFLVVRDNRVVYRTKEQQFSFNFPYQIGTNSDCLPESHADNITVDIREGDLIVAGTDGLFDNMFDEEIVDCIRQNGNSDPQEISANIAQTASKLAQEWMRLSPFAKSAHSSGLPFVFGGKVDDITVVVSRVVSEE